MSNESLLNHEQRLTRLEDRFEVNAAALMARLERLEEVAEQARVDKEQADRRELARLRDLAAQAEARG